ncbi:hypothetical protein Poly21_51840 [Allorhodopirellula heiligendammensis]|uniref:Uncharacterized protein n=1 Tax=Allorhodopirellula heiligendammensis TaxID=2714739 RepID=A0A5C6BID4_9BACT|nr:hypothetical protein Poly21_51840 [Allorhodopirellula heiligendammensis]
MTNGGKSLGVGSAWYDAQDNAARCRLLLFCPGGLDGPHSRPSNGRQDSSLDQQRQSANASNLQSYERSPPRA